MIRRDTPETVEAIRTLLNAGYSRMQVMRKLGIPWTSLGNIISKYDLVVVAKNRAPVEVPAWVPAWLERRYRAWAHEQGEEYAASRARSVKRRMMSGVQADRVSP